ncbi:MAG: tetratricopeptide repeat protein [Hormoscilla sp. GM7CHS1pb]|nr:tetratricopeptide repeat protein [Hormoscilla sp. GM7CHS1pb]
MSKKRINWIVYLMLVVAITALVGSSMIPVFGNALMAKQLANQSVQTTAAETVTPGLTPGRRGELESQARGYELVLEREPENQTALRGLLEVRLELVDIPGAIAPLTKLAELYPEEVNYGLLLAQAQEYIGDRQGASNAYRQVLAAHPGQMNALQGLVNLGLSAGDPQGAIELLEDSLKQATQANQLQPGTADTISIELLLGRVYASDQRYPEAIAVYDQAIEEDRNDFRPVLAKAIVLQTQGKTDEAQLLFSQAASLAPAQYQEQINQLAADDNPPTAVTAPSEQ